MIQLTASGLEERLKEARRQGWNKALLAISDWLDETAQKVENDDIKDVLVRAALRVLHIHAPENL